MDTIIVLVFGGGQRDSKRLRVTRCGASHCTQDQAFLPGELESATYMGYMSVADARQWIDFCFPINFYNEFLKSSLECCILIGLRQ